MAPDVPGLEWPLNRSWVTRTLSCALSISPDALGGPSGYVSALSAASTACYYCRRTRDSSRRPNRRLSDLVGHLRRCPCVRVVAEGARVGPWPSRALSPFDIYYFLSVASLANSPLSKQGSIAYKTSLKGLVSQPPSLTCVAATMGTDKPIKCRR